LERAEFVGRGFGADGVAGERRVFCVGGVEERVEAAGCKGVG
jgi:hypothetical protein